MPDTTAPGPATSARDGSARLTTVSLDDKYTATHGDIFLSGIQALVRLPMMQRVRDQAAGLNTAGFISGYRGSPLGGLDENLWKAKPHLEAHHVQFVPGVNEDLAATAVWGSQQVDLIGEAKYDGVFAMWYGKGPGVDRCGDVFKHMNHAGTSKHGGVLLVAGDDHGAYSSTLPHQSDHLFSASMIPVLYPCNVQEYLDLGIHGWAMSRFSGCTVAFKALADTVESSASVDADPFRVEVKIPLDFVMPEGGLNARLSSIPLGQQARNQEALMQDYKIYAALAYARENKLNHTTITSPNAKLGIIASGKSYLDVLEALEELGIDEKMAADVGLRLFKVAMPWPLEPDSVREFAQGLDEILVVEEKRQIVEYQLKEQLYNWRDDVRPRVIGKFDEKGEWVAPRGEWLLTSKADFSVSQVARVIASRVKRLISDPVTCDHIKARLTFLDAKDAVLKKAISTPFRPAFYCSGCPHNTSTKVPEGSLALAGIGCHVMATSIYPEFNKLTTHMGGEGAPWIGQAAFSKIPHVFQNLGDGTYFHSGYLAIRAAVAARVNMTYKILYNDAVAMTGGQPVDGITSVPMIAQQMAAEGVKRIALVTEDLGRYTDRGALPSLVSLHDRKDMDAVQRELRDVEGVSVLIYDQTCAAEKRRRRKKNEYPDPAKRMVINEAVCEGCGDCGVQSNCTSILPKETEFGRKRTIDQSSCNKDYSCVKGFCPSFVTVEGGTLKKTKTGVSKSDADDGFGALPEPELPSCEQPYPDQRHRRHRRDHRRRLDGHGRAPGGQRRVGAGHDRHVAEKRFRHLARQGGKDAGAPARAAHRHRRGRRHSRLRHADRRRRRRGVEDASGPHAGRHQPARAAARHLRAERRLAVPGGGSACADRGIGRWPRRGRFHRRHQAGHGADGRLHRRQSVHARLRVAARTHSADRSLAAARDRTQWRRHRVQQKELPVGPPRRRGPEARRTRSHTDAGDRRADAAKPGEHRRQARAVPDRLSKRRLRRHLRATGVAGAREGDRAGTGEQAVDRRGQILLQADGVQG
jgi:indolepyruvate ferredoxin oxidoreductase